MATRIPRREFEAICARRLPRGMRDTWFVQLAKDGDYDKYRGDKGALVMVRSGEPRVLFSFAEYRQV